MGRQITVTLDEHVARLLEEETRRSGISVDETVSEAVREKLEPFRIDARPLRAKEGVSFECIGRLLGESEEQSWRK